MTQEKVGVIKVCSNRGGIIFEDDPDVWYNALPSTKEYVKPEMKGKKVRIKLTEKDTKKFNFIEIVEAKSDGPEPEPEMSADRERPMTKDDYWARRADADKENQQQIRRSYAYAHALELIGLSLKAGTVDFEGADKKSKLTPETLHTLAETMANKVLDFIQRK